MTTAPHPPSVPLPDHATFARHVGETFTLRAADHPPVALDLIAATSRRQPGTPAAAPDRPFSLEFLSRGPAPLPQRIYRLEHPTLGALDLFLVPLGPRGGGMRFEAVFN